MPKVVAFRKVVIIGYYYSDVIDEFSKIFWNKSKENSENWQIVGMYIQYNLKLNFKSEKRIFSKSLPVK